jgi:3'-phosphoadenosine 5'-phosphosulfate sulfotransferase (PAPS reductase)/FAD synthetase
MYMSFKDIIAEQKKPLDYKIDKAVEAIRTSFEVCKSRAALAFSGGKDSTVLWHLIRTRFPEQSSDMAVIFGNTGVEYPESLKFALELGKEWAGDNFYEAQPEQLKKDGLKYKAQQKVLEYLIETSQISSALKPDGKLKTTQALERACPPKMWERFEREGLVWKKGTRKGYWWCVDQYGYPILGKAASKLAARRINIDCFLRFSKSASHKSELLEYYETLRNVKISQMCCDVLKKEPSERIQAELKVDVIFKGLMAEESHNRKVNFSTRGYLFKSNRKYLNTPFYHCNPISIWTDDDIWEYIHRYKVPYSPLYDITYKDKEGKG